MKIPLSLLLVALPPVALGQTWTRPPARGPALLLGPVLTYTELVASTAAQRGLAGHLELGGSIPVGYEENELFLLARVGGGAPGLSLGAHAGFRSVFELEEWQSYVELGVAVHVRPRLWAGPRVGLGARRALSEHLSLYAGLGGGLGFGSGLRLDVEVSTGVRWSL
jgi:hypothetical protein